MSQLSCIPTPWITFKNHVQPNDCTRRTGINLILAFAVALKHKLRFEPYTAYEDLAGLVGHLNTFAKAAHSQDSVPSPKPSTLKAVGTYLSVPMAISNPRKAIKLSKKPLGNLPSEILTHLASYVNKISVDNSLKLPVYQAQAGMYTAIGCQLDKLVAVF